MCIGQPELHGNRELCLPFSTPNPHRECSTSQELNKVHHTITLGLNEPTVALYARPPSHQEFFIYLELYIRKIKCPLGISLHNSQHSNIIHLL